MWLRRYRQVSARHTKSPKTVKRDKSKPALSVVVDLVGGGPNKTACPRTGIKRWSIAVSVYRRCGARCNMWNIPSMADGQGRALGSGSIPDVPLLL